MRTMILLPASLPLAASAHAQPADDIQARFDRRTAVLYSQMGGGNDPATCDYGRVARAARTIVDAANRADQAVRELRSARDDGEPDEIEDAKDELDTHALVVRNEIGSFPACAGGDPIAAVMIAAMRRAYAEGLQQAAAAK